MSKTLLKIAGIVAIVLGAFLCITIVGAIIGIPMIIGGNKFKSYSEMDENSLINVKESILTWSIIFLFICQFSGILGLIAYFQAFENNSFPKKTTYINELEELRRLYDIGVINKQEFEEKKKKILEREI